MYRLAQYTWFRGTVTLEVLLGLIGLAFFGIGVFFSRRYFHRSETAPADIGQSVPDEAKIKELGLSKREMEILGLVAKGHSNREIADLLFLSESTIKKHVSSLLVKLDAKRRTEALNIARELKLLS